MKFNLHMAGSIGETLPFSARFCLAVWSAGCDAAAMKQTGFASAGYAGKKRKTRRERLLEEMNAVVP